MSHRPVIVLCQPIYSVVPAMAHAKLCEFIGVNMGRGLLHGYFARVNAYIDEARNILVGRVLDETPATHLFFVDQDMILPPDTLGTLLRDDLDAVSAVYFDKSERHRPVGWSCLEPPARLEEFDPEGIQAVAGFGMGAMLLRTDFLRRMAERFEDREWFRSERCGEDMHFSRRAAEMGVDIHLDGRVQCGHVADVTLTADHWRAARELV